MVKNQHKEALSDWYILSFNILENPEIEDEPFIKYLVTMLHIELENSLISDDIGSIEEWVE